MNAITIDNAKLYHFKIFVKVFLDELKLVQQDAKVLSVLRLLKFLEECVPASVAFAATQPVKQSVVSDLATSTSDSYSVSEGDRNSVISSNLSRLEGEAEQTEQTEQTQRASSIAHIATAELQRQAYIETILFTFV